MDSDIIKIVQSEHDEGMKEATFSFAGLNVNIIMFDDEEKQSFFIQFVDQTSDAELNVHPSIKNGDIEIFLDAGNSGLKAVGTLSSFFEQAKTVDAIKTLGKLSR